jgi:hypothetical protein
VAQEFPDKKVAIELGHVRVLTNPNQNALATSEGQDWCQCCGCTKWRLARELFLPNVVAEKLREFGFELGQFALHSYYEGRLPPGLYRATRLYMLASAQIQGSGLTRQHFGRWHWMEVGPIRPDENPWLDDRLAGSLVVRLSTVLPDFESAVPPFEQDNSTPCPYCGRDFMSVGRIKSPHRVSKWFKIPESVARKRRTFRLCWGCKRVSIFRAKAVVWPVPSAEASPHCE